MLNIIKNYFKKAKEEVSKEYYVNSSDQAGSEKKYPFDPENIKLPEIWTGIDLDGTLACYDRSSSTDRIGEPVPAMMALVKKMINNGIRVKIFLHPPDFCKNLRVLIHTWNVYSKNNAFPGPKPFIA